LPGSASGLAYTWRTLVNEGPATQCDPTANTPGIWDASYQSDTFPGKYPECKIEIDLLGTAGDAVFFKWWQGG